VKTLILDSWPVLEWINGRAPSTALVDGLLEEAAAGRLRLILSAINVGEVYYFLRKNGHPGVAESWRGRAGTMPVEIETPDLSDIWAAATLKGSYPISYADGFAAALAQKHSCSLLTGDPEFRTVAGLTLDWIERAR
jgi:ribonuclease VapC